MVLPTTSRRLSATIMAMPQYRLRTTCPRATRIATIRAATASNSQARSLHASRVALGATKEDHMDRSRLNPTSTEYSKSGSDDKSAAMQDAAFNPNKTSPESEFETAEQESGEVRKQSSQVCFFVFARRREDNVLEWMDTDEEYRRRTRTL